MRRLSDPANSSAPADHRQEMHLALGIDGGPQPTRSHDVVYGNLEARGQGIASTETHFDARVPQLQSIDHVVHCASLNGHFALKPSLRCITSE